MEDETIKELVSLRKKGILTEQELMDKLCPEEDDKHICDILASVEGKVRKKRNNHRGLSWTEAEDTYLKEHYGKETSKSIGERFNRNVNSVTSRIYRLGLGKIATKEKETRTGKKTWTWTEKEDDLLRKVYPTKMHIKEISANLKRTISAIRVRAMQLRVHRLTNSGEARMGYGKGDRRTTRKPIEDLEETEYPSEKYQRKYKIEGEN